MHMYLTFLIIFGMKSFNIYWEDTRELFGSLGCSLNFPSEGNPSSLGSPSADPMVLIHFLAVGLIAKLPLWHTLNVGQPCLECITLVYRFIRQIGTFGNKRGHC